MRWSIGIKSLRADVNTYVIALFMAYLARLTLDTLPEIRTHDPRYRSKIHTGRVT